MLIAIKGLGPGGAERLLVDTLAARDRESFEYEVAFVMGAADALAPALSRQGLAVHDLGARSNLDLGWLRRFHRLVAEGGFDVVHFHLPYTAALGRLALMTLPRRRRPVTLYTEHSLWNKVSPPVKVLNRATVGQDGALVAVSEAAYRALPRRLRPRAVVVVHGIDLDAAARAVDERPALRARVRAELEVPDEEVLAVTVAGLRREKGHDVLLEAAGMVDRRGVPVRFVVAGDGVLAGELRARQEALGLARRVSLVGHRPDALELIAAADLFVLPSRQEGLPVVLMEAASVGTPIVASAVGGVPQVVRDGENGLLVPPGDPAALTRAIERFAGEASLRESLARGASAHRGDFDAKRATVEIEAIYHRLVGTPETSGGHGLDR